jgi:hypothetical protein
MKSSTTVQYTIRGVPAAVDKALRAKSRRLNQSLNAVALEALAMASGSGEQGLTYHDLDHLAGTWQEDPEFERAIRAQDQIDPKLWK